MALASLMKDVIEILKATGETIPAYGDFDLDELLAEYNEHVANMGNCVS